ncbi:MAG: thioredoxin domain-containing protein [Polyangiaceae bacterium]|nr:thioredoxin domain-containing protein [Polyangiaceae bacterium]
MKNGTVIAGFIVSFLAGMALMWGVDKSSGAPRATKDQPSSGAIGAAKGGVAEADGANYGSAKPGAVRVDLYVMSQCPYGVQAENGFADAVAKLGDDLDFRVDFIGDKTPSGDLSSMHGPKEVKGDMVQVCAQKYAPTKWFQMVLCQNKNMREVDTNWEACATEGGLPVDKLRACLDGEEGKSLLAESFGRSKARGASGSPTIYVGGQKYSGGRRGNDFFRAICNAYTGDKPAACASIPESPKVNVTILSDKRCAECDTRRMEGQLKSAVANPVMKTLDYSDAEGKKLFADAKPGMLPVAIFDATLDADKEAATALARSIKASGSYKILSMGGAWNPQCADDKGCELEECKATLQCKAEEPGKLDVFVMSQCPFGVKGLDALQEVTKNFGGKVQLAIHFIGDGDAKALKSMHGQAEVDEDIREVCAIEHYGKDLKYMDYIWCRNKSIKDPNWQACTGDKTGIDAEVIKKCSEGDEGKELLAKSFAYSKMMGIGASPTWLANGKYKFSGVDPESIKTQFCAHNKWDGCENKLSGPQNAGAAQPAGCGG